eukprot:SAG31_NODE_2841_length_5015_cov_1.524817_3_plen_100_part_00
MQTLACRKKICIVDSALLTGAAPSRSEVSQVGEGAGDGTALRYTCRVQYTCLELSCRAHVNAACDRLDSRYKMRASIAVVQLLVFLSFAILVVADSPIA